IRLLSLSEIAADSVTAVTASAHAAESAFFITSILQRGPLFPDLAERHNNLHRFLHVLPGHPLVPRVELVFTCEQLWCPQTHKGQPRAVGAAADGPRDHRQPAPADCVLRVLDDLGM